MTRLQDYLVNHYEISKRSGEIITRSREIITRSRGYFIFEWP